MDNHTLTHYHGWHGVLVGKAHGHQPCAAFSYLLIGTLKEVLIASVKLGWSVFMLCRYSFCGHVFKTWEIGFTKGSKSCMERCWPFQLGYYMLGTTTELSMQFLSSFRILWLHSFISDILPVCCVSYCLCC